MTRLSREIVLVQGQRAANIPRLGIPPFFPPSPLFLFLFFTVLRTRIVSFASPSRKDHRTSQRVAECPEAVRVFFTLGWMRGEFGGGALRGRGGISQWRLSRRALRRGPSSFIEKLPFLFPPPSDLCEGRSSIQRPLVLHVRDKEDSRETELDEKLATLAFRIKNRVTAMKFHFFFFSSYILLRGRFL